MIRLESQHEIAFPREAVWPILNKTDWLNRSLGLPPVDYETQPCTEGGSRVKARARVLGKQLRWRELPFEWLEPEFYRVRRVFENGPFKELRAGMDLHAVSDSATRVVAYSELTPRNVFGTWFAQRILKPKAERDMRQIVAQAEEFLRGRVKVPLPKLPVASVNEAVLQTGLKKLREMDQTPGLLTWLEQFLRESPDVELTHIRPRALARQWREDSWVVLRLFLQATRCGLLDLSWEVLCPNCRSSREPPAQSLNQLKRTAHCDVCQIEFNAQFDQSVELKFAVNSALRPRDAQTFCLAGPGGKPHVVSQLWLAPGEERACKLPPLPRRFRLRSPQISTPLALPADESSPRGLAISCEPTGFIATHETRDTLNGAIRIRNPNSFPVLLSLEQTEWSDDILTASRVTNWQEFRDLFATEIISPAEQITVGSQVVLFTDLRGSTAMYHGMGDAPAYVLVRNHFSILMEAIRMHHGTVVKTIGDAVMASFSRVDEALAAVRQMHDRLHAANPGLAAPLVLKSSVHVGSCLAVNANDKLDFFGTTINLAARMVECCQGGDLTVSDELFQRPEMKQFLEKSCKPPEPLEVCFRGFDTRHRVWRMEMV